MNITYIKNSSKTCMNILENIYSAMNTLSLTGYAQQKTNANCMEALQQVYEQLKNINEEASKEDDKPEG
mgnify:CR=1 FL=1|nr:MAG TPA: hypothetical protein [Caudoviricetes sp.]DAT69715.1 MAG TPA: hypothetical protein [Caudoviricetes sp.]